MPAFFARCLRGLEDICETKLAAVKGVNISGNTIRTIFFEYEGPVQSLVEIPCLDDVFLHLGSLSDMDHTRAMLLEIPQRLPSLFGKLGGSIDSIRSLRKLSPDPTYSLTIGLQGKKNFSRFELLDRLLPLFQHQLKGEYIPNEKASSGGELDFRISLEGDQLELGIRLAEKPLHRRDYKLHSRPGSTKAPLAYIMASLAKIEPNHQVLDPCCGVGTILIEAERAFPEASYEGWDIEEEALTSAQANAQLSGSEISFHQGDVRSIPLAVASVDRIISNPPWGRQVASHLELSGFYEQMYKEWKRVLRKEGIIVILTDQEAVMQKLLKAESVFEEISTHQLSLFGSVVQIYVWQKVS